MLKSLNIAYSTAATEAQYKSEYEPMTDTPHLALTGNLWGVYIVRIRE